MYEDILMIIGIILIAIIWSLKLVHVLVKILITIVAVMLILNYFGYLGSWNQPINAALTGTPETSCAYDSDCTIKSTLCQPCDCGAPVYKTWEKFCLFRDTRGDLIKCAGCPSNYHIVCKNNNCINEQQ